MKTISETPLKKLLNLIKSNFFRKSESEEVGELSIDTTPTADSDNLVTSGGVKEALDNGLANKQDTITSDNTLLYTGLHGRASYIQDYDSGLTILSNNNLEIDTLSEELRIQGNPNTTIKVHNQAYGLSINTTNIELGAYSTDGTITPYLTIGTGNQVLVDTPKVERQVANKKYVDDGLSNKQNKLTASNPIHISDDGGTISLNFGGGLYVNTNSSNILDVDWSRIPIDSSSPLYINDNNKLSLKCSSPLYIDTSNDNKLSVNISEIASNIAGWGLYESSNKLNVDAGTIGSDFAGRGLAYDNGKINSATYTTSSSTVTISDKTLTTIRATSSNIHFNNSNWVELTIARNGDNYSCWGMAQDTATTCNQYIYTVVGNTTNGAVTLDSTAFITETIIR